MVFQRQVPLQNKYWFRCTQPGCQFKIVQGDPYAPHKKWQHLKAHEKARTRVITWIPKADIWWQCKVKGCGYCISKNDEYPGNKRWNHINRVHGNSDRNGRTKPKTKAARPLKLKLNIIKNYRNQANLKTKTKMAERRGRPVGSLGKAGRMKEALAKKRIVAPSTTAVKKNTTSVVLARGRPPSSTAVKKNTTAKRVPVLARSSASSVQKVSRVSSPQKFLNRSKASPSSKRTSAKTRERPRGRNARVPGDVQKRNGHVSNIERYNIKRHFLKRKVLSDSATPMRKEGSRAQSQSKPDSPSIARVADSPQPSKSGNKPVLKSKVGLLAKLGARPRGRPPIVCLPCAPPDALSQSATPQKARQSATPQKAISNTVSNETPGRLNEYMITLDKRKGERLGIDVVNDGLSLMIEGVHAGLVQKWNEKSSEGLTVKRGDYFVEVNGIREMTKLVEELRKEQVLKIKCHRAGMDESSMVIGASTASSARPELGSEFSITLDQTKGDLLGIDVESDSLGGSLVVERVNAGLVQSWNENNAGQAIRQGDCLVEVNGIRDVIRLEQELRKEKVLAITYRIGNQAQNLEPRLNLAEGSTCVIFDWDDTLFPTSYVKNIEDSCSMELEDAMFKSLALHLTTVKDLLKAARKVARVAIVTLATRDWVRQAAHDYLSTEHFDFEQFLSDLDIPVYSARENLAKTGQPNKASTQVRAKKDAMTEYLKHFMQTTGRSASNIISIGDSFVELKAVKEAASAVNGCCKSVLINSYTETRPIGSLTLELRDLTRLMGQLVATLKRGERGQQSCGNL